MTALSIQVPFPVFQDRDGQPLDNGYVWIGTANLYPITNPVVAYFDSALTIVAAQPLRTLNGYISNAGTPAQVYVDGVNFSILVQDSKGTMVYNFPDGTGISANAEGVIYDPAGTGAVATNVQAKLRESVSVLDFGADPTGVLDSYAAIIAAINSLGNSGGIVIFPPGSYICNQTIELYTQVQLVGSSSGLSAHANYAATKIIFPVNTSGIIVQRFNTTGLSGVLGVNKLTGGDGSIICGIELNGSGISGNGITLRARAEVVDCRVYSFGNHGIAVTAGSDGNPVLGNANSWRIDLCRISGCLGSGVYVVGTDANAGNCSNVDVTSCGTYGFYEASFLKNTYLACHAVDCPSANYYAANYSIFLGCYSESGSGGDAATWGNGIFFGGIIGNGINSLGNTIQITASATVTGGFLQQNRPTVISPYGKTISQRYIGYGLQQNVFQYSDATNFPGQVNVGPDSVNDGLDFSTKYGTTFTYYNILTGPNTALKFRRVAAVPFATFIPKLFIGNGISYFPTATTGLALTSSDAAPTTDEWAKGDIVFNQNATAGGFAGWICTTAGTPGTWKTFGAISA